MPRKQRNEPNLAYASPRTNENGNTSEGSNADRGTAPVFGSQGHRTLLVDMCANLCKDDPELLNRFVRICGLSNMPESSDKDSSAQEKVDEMAEKTEDLRRATSHIASLTKRLASLEGELVSFERYSNKLKTAHSYWQNDDHDGFVEHFAGMRL